MRRASSLLTVVLLVLAGAGAGCGGEPGAARGAEARRVLDLSGEGWSLWLDREAAWEGDGLHLPGVDLASLPVHAPTGGWERLDAAPTSAAPAGAGASRPALDRPLAVSVPSTVEAHFWDALAAERRAPDAPPPDRPDTAGDYLGVSWWWREFDVPADWLAAGPRGAPSVTLQFDAVRLRAEVFLDGALVGYDAVGNTPFAVELGGRLSAGRHVLAVRVTDPGGNFDWTDHDAHRWGSAPDAPTIPASHGFGGVTGPVRLVVRDAVHIEDVLVRNTSQPGTVRLAVTVRNTTGVERGAALALRLRAADGAAPAVADTALRYEQTEFALRCPPGASLHEVELSPPGVALWSPEAPHLYVARLALHLPEGEIAFRGDGSGPLQRTGGLGPEVDVVEQRFGFRSFTVEGVGDDAVFRLNGERVFLTSAISWGFWPVTGMVPSPELARRQIESAKALGLNMLNHHRCAPATGLLDLHDELGLLAYVEPGGYASAGGDALCLALAREKLLRVVRAAASHPSVVIFNLINEELREPTEAQRADLAAAQALDPSRTITFTSGWAVEGPDSRKLHARPWEAGLHESGWWDYHNAPGPGTWRDLHWKGPDEHLRRTENRAEIVFWGEEGANASPPRLALIEKEVDPAALGWDGAAHRTWSAHWRRWLAARPGFLSLDELTLRAGAVAHDYQVRALENVRLGDLADGYVINGWESELLENHSGIVDLWRHPKADPGALAAALAPRRLVVRARQSVVQAGEWVSPALQAAVRVTADVGLIDTGALAGPHRLRLTLRAPGGRQLWQRTFPVEVRGGDVFGELLLPGLEIDAEVGAGTHGLIAELLPGPATGGAPAAAETVLATGHEALLVVDWKGPALPVHGALFERGRALRRFFETSGKAQLPVYHSSLPPLDYVLVGDHDPEPRETVPAEAFGAGLSATYRRGTDPDAGEVLLRRTDAQIDFEWSRSEPDPAVGPYDFSVRWEGTLTPPESGAYLLHMLSDDGARLWIDGQLVVDYWLAHSPAWRASAPLQLQGGRAHALRLEYAQSDGLCTVKLAWTTPERQRQVDALLDSLLQRVRDDGTTVCFLHRADTWAALLAERGLLEQRGRIEHGRYWLGGGFFGRAHPLLDGLPAEGAWGRFFQELVHYGAERASLRLVGEECVVGGWSDHQYEPGTSLGIVRVGQGRVLLCALDILRSLNGEPGPADVTRTLFCNIVRWAGSPPR